MCSAPPTRLILVLGAPGRFSVGDVPVDGGIREFIFLDPHTTSSRVHDGRIWCITAHRNPGAIPTLLDRLLPYGLHDDRSNMSAPTGQV